MLQININTEYRTLFSEQIIIQVRFTNRQIYQRWQIAGYYVNAANILSRLVHRSPQAKLAHATQIITEAFNITAFVFNWFVIDQRQ